MPPIQSKARPSDQGVALVAVLITLVLVVPLAVGALGIVVKRQKDVVYERSRTSTAHAAEAGLDAATLAIRAAASGGVGLRGKLPCAGSAAITGTVGVEARGVGYSVTIRYYLLDPLGQPEAWRQANELTCTPGQGPSATPHFALLQSIATGSQTRGSFAALRERSLESVYRFQPDDANIAGGLVRPSNPGGAEDLCWSADVPDGATPAAGSGSIVATCQYGSAAQMLSYRPDHSIYNLAGRLCLTTTGVLSSQLTFETCTGALNQVWIYNTSGHIQMVDATGSVVNSCIAMAQANVPRTPLLLSPDCASANSQWSPEARTGPGGAGEAQYQLVNVAQFARCLDVPGEDWNNDFLQLHPCAQSPTALDWPAQQLVYDATTGHFLFGNPHDLTNHCLTSPPPGGDHIYVTTNPCSGGSPHQRWTLTGDTGLWATSYTILDDDGRCLAQGPVPAEPGWTFNSVIVAPCDGGLAEKWNAPPESEHAGLEGFRETTGQ